MILWAARAVGTFVQDCHINLQLAKIFSGSLIMWPHLPLVWATDEARDGQVNNCRSLAASG